MAGAPNSPFPEATVPDQYKWPSECKAGRRFPNISSEKAHRKTDMAKQMITRQKLMGCAHRSPITGEINLRGIEDIPDFFVVDLLERQRLPQTVQDLAGDPYLFRPVPLKYRTWLYHEAWRRLTRPTIRFKGSAKNEHQMMFYALSLPTIDAPIRAGRYSTLIFFVPGCFFPAVVGDGTLTLGAMLLLYLLYGISTGTNSPGRIRHERMFTAPLRLGFLAFLIIPIIPINFNNIVGAIGRLATALLLIVDFLVGDLSVVRNLKFMCTHQVMRILPSRVYVCHRIGAEFTEKAFGERGEVPECITGFRPWTSKNSLVADVGGLICELRPMSAEDWLLVAEEWSMGGGRPLPYVCLGTFAEYEDGLVRPSGLVHDVNMEAGESTWAQSRKGAELVVEDIDGTSSTHSDHVLDPDNDLPKLPSS